MKDHHWCSTSVSKHYRGLKSDGIRFVRCTLAMQVQEYYVSKGGIERT